ncbi:MAG TPA: glycerol-3-phosphate acyltransferase [bacterium]|nr:glycerol-3-phosphate acyltransferase [bacterium]
MIHPVFSLVVGYLLGAMPLGYWSVLTIKRVDVRKHGSGNIGMTNVWRTVGPGWGILTLLLDIGKAVLAVQLAGVWGKGEEAWMAGAGLAVLLGNVFSVFLGFKGGKGIGVSVGVFYSLLALESALGTAAFAVGLASTRMISVGSLLGVTTMAVLALVRHGVGWASGLATLGAVMVWWTHRENIQRIRQGTERRIGSPKKGKK